jgi:hypothetical protein
MLVCARAARLRLLAVAVGVAAAATVQAGRPALAGKHDLRLQNLCEHRVPAAGQLNGQVLECSWVQREGSGLINAVAPGADAESNFRSLMSELGAVVAPRIVVPADTIGFGGFQFSGELGLTSISHTKSHWNGVEGVQTSNPAAVRPESMLTTVGAFVRKGIWLGLPAFELGAGAVNVVDSHLVAWQGYAKVALHEGFHRWPIPSVAARGGLSYLTGTDQARMTVASLDFIASKRIGIMGTFRLEPYVGLGFLFINAASGVMDLTPSCDAYVARRASGTAALGDYCSNAQRGTDNDLRANFAFPDQDGISRTRYFAGSKVKFATVFLSAQYERIPSGSSRDERKPNGARDGSGSQEGLALSGGFDF